MPSRNHSEQAVGEHVKAFQVLLGVFRPTSFWQQRPSRRCRGAPGWQGPAGGAPHSGRVERLRAISEPSLHPSHPSAKVPPAGQRPEKPGPGPPGPSSRPALTQRPPRTPAHPHHTASGSAASSKQRPPLLAPGAPPPARYWRTDGPPLFLKLSLAGWHTGADGRRPLPSPRGPGRRGAP